MSNPAPGRPSTAGNGRGAGDPRAATDIRPPASSWTSLEPYVQVLRALLPLIPGAHFVYLGDTARLPYGAKSRATVARYAVESARFLAAHLEGAESQP